MMVHLDVLMGDNRQLFEYSLLDIDRDHQVLNENEILLPLRSLTAVYTY